MLHDFWRWDIWWLRSPSWLLRKTPPTSTALEMALRGRV